MEDHTTTDATLDAFETVAREQGGGRRCLRPGEPQADSSGRAPPRRRSRKIRFVKGAYDPPADVAYADGERIDQEYRTLLEYAFEHYNGGIAVGSHDPAMLEYATALHERSGTAFEVQMLMRPRDRPVRVGRGVRCLAVRPLRRARWKSYFYRRAMERRENLRFALRLSSPDDRRSSARSS